MALEVVGAGVGRTGTHSLKLALEQLLGGPCHHMVEVLGSPEQAPGWIDAIEGRPVDWTTMLAGYVSLVDWPGCSFWPELSAANPEALVLLSVRDPESWYRSASNTIFQLFDRVPPELKPWMEAVRRLLRDRFSDRLDDPTAMMDVTSATTRPCVRRLHRRACWNGPQPTGGTPSVIDSAWTFPVSRSRSPTRPTTSAR